jgi:NAD(P)-dependent dehydrogenase (short-subunit alcohol dehydrogenase family)
MASRFGGKLALVAGGTGGLGRAVSLAFLNEAATVAVTYRNQEGFTALKKAAGSGASSLRGHQIDVTDEVAAGHLVKTMLAEGGRLDVMVNAVVATLAASPCGRRIPKSSIRCWRSICVPAMPYPAQSCPRC